MANSKEQYGRSYFIEHQLPATKAWNAFMRGYLFRQEHQKNISKNLNKSKS